jgi:hypothetical protein
VRRSSSPTGAQLPHRREWCGARPIAGAVGRSWAAPPLAHRHRQAQRFGAVQASVVTQKTSRGQNLMGRGSRPGSRSWQRMFLSPRPASSIARACPAFRFKRETPISGLIGPFRVESPAMNGTMCSPERRIEILKARTKAFRFPKGQSGNPDGQSRFYHEARKIAREAPPRQCESW